MPPIALLAGGLAKRMWPLTERVPKALLEVAGETIISRMGWVVSIFTGNSRAASGILKDQDDMQAIASADRRSTGRPSRIAAMNSAVSASHDRSANGYSQRVVSDGPIPGSMR
jgi:mannose-1-phosphate guanylyltransferase